MLKRPVASLGVGTMMKVASVSATAAETTPVLVDQLLEARFIDRGLTRIDGSDESRVHVGADDPKALVREDGGKRCPELAEPNHRNLHLDARPPPPVES